MNTAYSEQNKMTRSGSSFARLEPLVTRSESLENKYWGKNMIETIDKSDMSKKKGESTKKYTKEMGIEAIQMFHKENNRPPMARDFLNNPRYPSWVTIRSLFGSFNNGIIVAGYKPNEPNKAVYTKDMCTDAIKRFVKQNGRIPTESDFTDNIDYPSDSTIWRLFGSWNKAIEDSGFDVSNENHKGRLGEIQTINEFRKEGAVDLSGQNRHSTCDGQCPKGELYDVKSASLRHYKQYQTNTHDGWGWAYSISEKQLKEASYLFLRAYETSDFNKPPKYKWRIPIEILNNRKSLFVYKNDNGRFYIKNMKKYEQEI